MSIEEKKACFARENRLNMNQVRLKLRLKSGRGDRIRTCDPLLPKQMRYQTALLPDVAVKSELTTPRPALATCLVN